MKIIYDGDRLEVLVQKLPKESSFLIMDSDRWLRHRETDFLYVLDESASPEKFEDLKEGMWVCLLGRKAGKTSSADYPALRFTKKLTKPPLLPQRIHLLGPMQPIAKFVAFLLKENNFVLSYEGEKWKEEYLEEELLKKEAFRGRLRKEKANLHICFERGEPNDVHIFFWDGKTESLFALAEERSRLPAELFVLRAGLRSIPLKEQSVLRGRDLGRMHLPGALRKTWREILRHVERSQMTKKENAIQEAAESSS